MNILSIQSHVVLGHVGNSAATLALQRLGFEVWAVPTVLFSNHPAHGGTAGDAVAPDAMGALVGGLDSLGALARCGAVLSGYLASPGAADVVAEAVAMVRAHKVAAPYLCDPAFAHEDGLFVSKAVAEAVRTRLIPSASIAAPNPFELADLTKVPVDSLESALEACRALRGLGPETAICTSLPLGGGALGTLAVAGEEAWLVETPELPGPLHGAGDLFSAVFLGHTLRGLDLAGALGAAVSGTFGVLEATGTALDLALVAAQDEIVSPSRTFAARKIG
ncbi:MAG: pyridoxal kinase [Proteobacteria bacterium]|nr:pyridoxal kinase [Pseudomonadota bacterium]MCH8187785.1 pyridoxal kinase [Pseudomonadota bacterium]